MNNLEFPYLKQIEEESFVIGIDEANTELAKEIQQLLSEISLYRDKIDGIVGDNTRKALASFKASIWLDSPTLIGASTAKSLLEIAEKHRQSEQAHGSSIVAPVEIGERTGRTLSLPNGITVFQNELIIPGIPLTWGEFTHGCVPERTPESNQVIENILKTTRGFGKIRDAYGSPLTVNSAYRPPSVNRRVGGARFSQHITGLAIDISPIDGNFNKLLQVCRDSDCIGLGRGMHRGFIHCDWRNSSSRVVFDYG
jgi:peptidoglycan hydrolase-like protein with peptidoglycan-binding domain